MSATAIHPGHPGRTGRTGYPDDVMPVADEVCTTMYGRCGICGAPLGPRVTVKPDGIVRALQSCRDNPEH